MTPPATYIAEENCLQEESRVEKPERDYDDYDPYSEHWNYWVGEWREYENHLATLRKIPCDPSCKGLWADQQKVVEGVDYVVKKHCEHADNCLLSSACIACDDVAFPLVPVKSEEQDDLWRDVFDMINGGAIIDDVEKLYIITKR